MWMRDGEKNVAAVIHDLASVLSSPFTCIFARYRDDKSLAAPGRGKTRVMWSLASGISQASLACALSKMLLASHDHVEIIESREHRTGRAR